MDNDAQERRRHRGTRILRRRFVEGHAPVVCVHTAMTRALSRSQRVLDAHPRPTIYGVCAVLALAAFGLVEIVRSIVSSFTAI